MTFESEAEYNILYDRIVNLLKDKNFCKFDSSGLCVRERMRPTVTGKVRKINYCCCGREDGEEPTSPSDHCKHFEIGKGCTTKSIFCKIWFCDYVTIPYKIQQEINDIKNEAERKKFSMFRGNFEDIKNAL